MPSTLKEPERGSGLEQDEEFSYRPAGYEVSLGCPSRVILLPTGNMVLDLN